MLEAFPPQSLRFNGSFHTLTERTKRSIEDAAAKRYPYESKHQFRRCLADFSAASSFDCKLKAINGLNQRGFICKACTAEPSAFPRIYPGNVGAKPLEGAQEKWIPVFRQVARTNK